MSKFRIQPHGRLQEWVAEEKGYFKDEGLDYEFVHSDFFKGHPSASVQSATMDSMQSAKVRDVTKGAFESYQEGRGVEISAACHWTVNMAATQGHGRMWGHAYSMTPAGIFVPPESPVRSAKDLAGVEVAVSYHSGSHFSALQSLEKFLEPEEISLKFVGGPNDRLPLIIDRKVSAANLFSAHFYVAEQLGFRKIVDTSFMIGFLFADDADMEDMERYFKALRRAQQEIDRDLGLYKHYYMNELPERYRDVVDVQAFGAGERLVFEPYTREMYEETQRWLASWELFEGEVTPDYDSVVVAD